MALSHPQGLLSVWKWKWCFTYNSTSYSLQFSSEGFFFVVVKTALLPFGLWWTLSLPDHSWLPFTCMLITFIHSFYLLQKNLWNRYSLFAFICVNVINVVFIWALIEVDNFCQDPVLLLVGLDPCCHLVARLCHVVTVRRHSTA